MSQNKVLFVDDEANVLSSIRRAVMDEDFLPFFAGSGEAALALMESHEFSVVVTDMRMPVMDGLSLLKIVKEKYPRSVRVVLSGYTQLSQLLATINQGEIFKFITKPWATEADLLPVIRQAIEYYNLQAERDHLRDGLEKRNLAYQKIFREMEQKQAQEKETLVNLHKISEWMFVLWRKNIVLAVDESKEHATKLDEIVDVAETIYLTYLNQLPMLVDVRDSATLINDIVKSSDNRLVINNVLNSDFKTLGNHNYLLMMFRILIHNIPAVYTNIRCELVKNKHEEGSLTLNFDIGLQSYEFSDSDKTKLKVICAILNKMGTLYNASVVPTYVNDELCYIRVVWEAKNAQ